MGRPAPGTQVRNDWLINGSEISHARIFSKTSRFCGIFASLR